MGKMSELDMAIKDLRTAAATINDVANSLAELFGSKPEEQPATPAGDAHPAGDARPAGDAHPAEPKLTLEQVRAVLAEKSRKGHTAEVRSLLQKYGASKLSAVDPVHYKDLLADAEVLDDGN